MDNGGKITPAQLRVVLHGVDIFEMLLGSLLDEVIEAGEIRSGTPGTLLFESGDQAEGMYVLLDGLVEILRKVPGQPGDSRTDTVAPGETIGELAILTGTRRNCAARFVRPSAVWHLGRLAFQGLFERIPGYGVEIAKVFARRLENLLTHHRRRAAEMELSGKLAHFDLSSVFQTLIVTNQSGVLSVLDSRERTVASVLFESGDVSRARCRHLHGVDAFAEILLRDEEGEFTFRSELPSDSSEISPRQIELSAMGVIMEAMRQKDELPKLLERLPGLDRPYRWRSRELRWDDEATEPIAREIKQRLKEPKLLSELVPWLPCSTYRFYRIVVDLHESGQIH